MLKIAIAGLGNVGGSVVRLLQQQRDLLRNRTGKRLAIVGVTALDKGKKRSCDLTDINWVQNPLDLAATDADVVVELIGGASGVAYDLVKAALEAGKHVVTANKALIAEHGVKFAALAEDRGVSLMFEAAVAGGIPVIKTLRESLAGNHVQSVQGILNGTCNYILSSMWDRGLDLEAALKEAQDKGYAEANPSADIDGVDTANKLAILSALAFGTVPNTSNMTLEGIRRIVPTDLAFADDLKCRVKLLGSAHGDASGIVQRVGPCLVPLSSPLSQVSGAMNAVMMRGDFVGDVLLYGQGAGGPATASAVVADLVDVARGNKTPPFGQSAEKMQKPSVKASDSSRYYIRLQVADQPGVVAAIAGVLRDESISIEAIIQRGNEVAGSVPLVIMTHRSPAVAIRRVMTKLLQLKEIAEPPCLMPIEE
ncbi:MAG: homoserine dehydrogenase [Alphaproteobacteria bacterium]|nr:homoserine dehydrogenase [Alphaproteobacteria bacterium]